MGSSSSTPKINIEDCSIVQTFTCKSKTTNSTKYWSGYFAFHQNGAVNAFLNDSNPCGKVWHNCSK